MEYNYIPRPDKNTENANKSNCNHPYIDVNDAMNQFEESSTDWCIFCSEGHVALDRNPESGYIILLLRMIQGDLLSACPHRQFHTLYTRPFRQLGCTAKLLP